MNMEDNTVYSSGLKDTADKWTGKPVFKDGNQEFTSEDMKYNFKTGKGYVKNIVTQEGEGYVQGAPDIYRFVDCKTEDGKLSYFNVSVAVSDKLMKEAARDGAFDLHSRADGSVVRTVSARELMDHISESAWKRGDPGVGN